MNLPTSSDYPLILHGDCVEEMRQLPEASVHAVVTDPPYGINFMGKAWDAPGGMLGQMATGDEQRGAYAYGGSPSRGYADNDNAAFGAWCETWLTECLRVLKPGGHLLAFGGTRTWHRLAVAVEDAGFEIRDSMAWLYGSGFPKSLDVSKALDKAAGAQREVVGLSPRHGGGIVGNGSSYEVSPEIPAITAPATDAAKQWHGWGTALKPAFEPIVVARKPLMGTVAANVLEHGTGALNVEACRIDAVDGYADQWDKPVSTNISAPGGRYVGTEARHTVDISANKPSGRWPANVVLDEHTAAIVDEQSGLSISKSGGASRFFYVAKAPSEERPTGNGTAHPTVKPLDLMRWLVRLVAPPGGIVLEPFAGSGTTVEACIKEDVRCIAIEREADYLPLINERINRNNLSLFAGGEV